MGWRVDSRVIQGDCRDVMRSLIADGVRVQCVVTSPPYWGLRDYGCDGQLGLERTYPEFIAGMVEVFGLVRQLLADDGTLWLNLGDSYATGAGKAVSPGGGAQGERFTECGPARPQTPDGKNPQAGIPTYQPNRMPQPGLKPKDLCGIPWRLAFALQDAGWWLRQDIIWSKPNPMPESVTDRCTKAHEYLFLLAKSEKYFYDAQAIKEPASPDTHARYARGRSDDHKWADGGPGNQTIAKSFAHMQKPVSGWDNGPGGHREKVGRYSNNGVGFGHGYDKEPKPRVKERKLAEPGSGTKNNSSFDAAMAVMPETRNKRSVWQIPTQPYPEAHFATFPEALVEPCILAGSRPGDIVFDPFMGSGTVAADIVYLTNHCKVGSSDAA